MEHGNETVMPAPMGQVDMELGRVRVVGAKIRGTPRYSHRSGEWGLVVGVVFVTPGPRLEPRPAYVVQYEDGKIDHIALYDRDNYELAQAA
jgi:hypothetical protein